MSITANSPSQRISTDEIEVRDTILAAEFKRDFIARNRPLLMRRMTDDWPAMQSWSFDYFAGLSMTKSVYLEQKNVMQGEAAYAQLSYGEYIQRLIDDDEGEAASAGYLSVFKIFRSFPELAKDVDFSILSQHKIKSTVAGWIGPAGTVTGYHVDWGDNALAQVCGRKEVRLVSPAESKCMYPSNRFDQGTLSSRVDADNYDEEAYPLFKQANQRTIILHPGDMLFIPRGWWHHVRSLDKSISVSNLGYDAKGIVVDLLSHRLKQLLHDWGLYRVPCTCHFQRDGKRVRRAVTN